MSDILALPIVIPLINTVITSGIVLLGYWLAGKRLKDKESKLEMGAKVDVTAFESCKGSAKAFRERIGNEVNDLHESYKSGERGLQEFRETTKMCLAFLIKEAGGNPSEFGLTK